MRPLTIRRRRVTRSRRWRKAQDGVRARCRRIEAWMLVYLAVSSHVLYPLRGSGAQRADHDEDGASSTIGVLAMRMDRGATLGDGGRGRPNDGDSSVRMTEGWRWRRVDGKVRHRWWSNSSRVGEASHPGPLAVTIAAEGLLRRTCAAARAVVLYPRPGEGSLRGAIAPGFELQRRGRDEPQQRFQLRVESANTTGWRALQRRLVATRAHVLLAQETWLSQDAVHAASAWAKRNGWKSIWAAAVEGPNGGASGGTAIFVRDYLGLRYPPDGPHVWVPGRVVAAVLDVPEHRPMLVVSAYLIHGIGPAPANLDILSRMGQRIRAVGEEYEVVVGGDFNMEPPDFMATDFHTEIDAEVLLPATERGTFRTARSATLIDFFVVTSRLAAAVRSVVTEEGTNVRGHTPVALLFKPEVTTLRALHLRRPPRLERERVYGPLPPPPDWSLPRQAAQRALEAARAGRADVQTVLDEAYRAWADQAEAELADYCGVLPKKLGERGRLPRLAWRSVVPERAPMEKAPIAAAASWLKAVAVEGKRIGTSAGIGTSPGSEPGGDAVDDAGADPAGFVDEADADEVARRETQRGRARRPPTSARACRDVLREMQRSLFDDFPDCGAGQEAQRLMGIRDCIATEVRSLEQVLSDGDEGERRQAMGGPENDDEHHRSMRDRICGALGRLQDEAEEVEARATAEGKVEDRRRWSAWVSEGIERGAARAHAYSRAPKAWTPTEVLRPDGSRSSAVDDLINAQRDKYRRLWRPAAGPFRYEWQQEDELPPLGAQRIRSAAATFAEGTATTYDGFHPRQVGLLCDDALEVLSMILAAVEAAAVWPSQVSLVVAALLPKESGGFRPIGIAAAIYRIWSKARREEADAWERRYPRSFFAAAKGDGPIDAMWRLAARQEAGIADGEVAATVTEDLHAFFETVDRDRLVREARAVGFPIAIIKAALAAYSSARMVTMNGRVSRELYPTAGVLAGCSLAMALTKVYSVRAFDRFVEEAPPTTKLDTFVDDLTLSACGTRGAVVDDLAEAHELLAEIVRDVLLCDIAPGKSTATATTRGLAGTIARRVGISGGVTGTATILGIDNAAAAPRAALRRNSKKAKRLRAALARAKRLRQIQRTVGSRARKVFVAGIQPAATFGAHVWGVDNSELAKLRRLAAAALRPYGRCRSLGATLLWHGTPTAAAEHAPILQLARMTWAAVVQREAATQKGASIAELRRWWDVTSGYFAPIAAEFRNVLASAQAEGVEFPLSTARKIWGKVRGPFGAAALAAERIGWQLLDPFTIRDQHGTVFLLTNTSPALVRKLAEEALRAKMEFKLAAQYAKDEPCFRGRRACFDFVTSAVRHGRGLAPHQRGVMRAVACGALVTGQRAIKMGYQVCGLCPLCKGAPDTLRHRFYHCPNVKEAVRAVVPDWFWREAVCAAEDQRFWTTGVCPNPADLAPLPCLDLGIVVEAVDGTVGEQDADDIARLRGRLYVDGSCTAPVVKDLARAACAVVQTDEAGHPQRVLRVAVPRHLPQTAQAAENFGLGIAVGALDGPATLVGDCLNVVRAANGEGRNPLGPTKTYAGILLSLLAQPVKRRWAGEVQWTKAHRSISGGETAEVLRDIRGNQAADLAAKAAVALHPAIGTEAETELAFYERRIHHVVKAAVTALEFFPRAPGDMPRAPKPVDEQQARRRSQHLWEYRGGAWRCSLCHDWVTAPRLPRYRRYQQCSGKTLADAGGTMARRGHSIYRADAELPIIFCGNCGAWGHRRTHRLSLACGPPKASGIQALRRIRAGVHPMQRRGPGGTLLQREYVRTVARYCEEKACWIQMCEDRPCTFDHGMQTTGGPEPAHEGVGAANDDETTHGWGRSAGTEAVDEMMTMPHFVDEDVDFFREEEDVFGHGGSMDLEPCDLRPVMGTSTALERRDKGSGQDRSCGEMPGVDAHSVHRGASTVAACRGAKSIREPSCEGSAQAAIRRMMQGSRPSSGDAAERIRAVKRRIGDRIKSATGGAHTVQAVIRAEADVRVSLPPASEARSVRTAIGDIEAEGDAVGSCAMSVQASDVHQQGHVDVACAGPGDPSARRVTETATWPTAAADVAETVAEAEVVAALVNRRTAREAQADLGEATYGPPRGCAAPREDTKDTASEALGREASTSLQATRPADGGGGPPVWHYTHPPQSTPPRLGAGPSDLGRADCDGDGGWPATEVIVRRRDGNVDPGARASAARRGSVAAEPSPWDKPSEGLSRRRVRDARNEYGVNAHGSPISCGDDVPAGGSMPRAKRSRGGGEDGNGRRLGVSCTADQRPEEVAEEEQPEEERLVQRLGEETPRQRPAVDPSSLAPVCGVSGHDFSRGMAAPTSPRSPRGSVGHDNLFSPGGSHKEPAAVDREGRAERGRRRRKGGAGEGGTREVFGSRSSSGRQSRLRQRRGPANEGAPAVDEPAGRVGSAGSDPIAPSLIRREGITWPISDDESQIARVTHARRAVPPRGRRAENFMAPQDAGALDAGGTATAASAAVLCARQGHGGGEPWRRERASGGSHRRQEEPRTSTTAHLQEDTRGVPARDTVGDQELTIRAAAAPGAVLGDLEREDHGATDVAASVCATPEDGNAADTDNLTQGFADHGDAADRRRRPPDAGDRGSKRRRLRGKQPPSGGMKDASTGTTIDVGTVGDSRGRPGRSGCNSVHVGISACPSRSTTSSLDRLAPTDRDGHVLVTRPAASSTARVGGLAQHGAGPAERARGRGRPPEA